MQKSPQSPQLARFRAVRKASSRPRKTPPATSSVPSGVPTLTLSDFCVRPGASLAPAQGAGAKPPTDLLLAGGLSHDDAITGNMS